MLSSSEERKRQGERGTAAAIVGEKARPVLRDDDLKRGDGAPDGRKRAPIPSRRAVCVSRSMCLLSFFLAPFLLLSSLFLIFTF